jgi:hypothetical protein
MKEVSFIMTGRDDGYTGNFIDRFKIALEKNLKILSNHDLTYDIIVVDYNPYEGKRLIDNPNLSELLKNENITNLIVDRSVVLDDGLFENGFYEYFGKNAAAVRSNSKYLFMTNADIILSDDIVKYLKELSKSIDDNHFYRIRYRQDIENGNTVGAPIDLCNMHCVDSEICGGYSGDATIFSRKVFNEIATGYNETDPAHRTSCGQASMDGEILWNLVKNNVTKIIVDLTYYHVTHTRQSKDVAYSREKYINRENWGYQNYPCRVINSNTLEIYNENISIG